MVRIWPEFFAAFFPPTAGERLADALAEIEELRDECKAVRFEREIMRHDRDFCAARLTEVEAGVVALQKALDDAEAVIRQVEERFPNWRGYRDLIDCIDVTMHWERAH